MVGRELWSVGKTTMGKLDQSKVGCGTFHLTDSLQPNDPFRYHGWTTTFNHYRHSSPADHDLNTIPIRLHGSRDCAVMHLRTSPPPRPRHSIRRSLQLLQLHSLNLGHHAMGSTDQHASAYRLDSQPGRPLVDALQHAPQPFGSPPVGARSRGHEHGQDDSQSHRPSTIHHECPYFPLCAIRSHLRCHVRLPPPPPPQHPRRLALRYPHFFSAQFYLAGKYGDQRGFISIKSTVRRRHRQRCEEETLMTAREVWRYCPFFYLLNSSAIARGDSKVHRPASVCSWWTSSRLASLYIRERMVDEHERFNVYTY